MKTECVKIDIQDIEKRLKNIFRKKLEIDFDKLETDMLDDHLLSKKIGLAPRDLLYLLRSIEEEFNIIICHDDIGEGRFTTFNNILSLIYDQV